MNEPAEIRAVPAPLADDLLDGVAAIAAEIGRTKRQTYHLLEGGLLPGCFKLGGKWAGARSQIRAGLYEMASRPSQTEAA